MSVFAAYLSHSLGQESLHVLLEQFVAHRVVSVKWEKTPSPAFGM